MATNNYLFVYGTLLDDKNKFGGYLKNKCSFYAEGKFSGRLYDVADYPGAILADHAGYVRGKIFMIRDTGAVLQLLDDYEGFGPGQEQPNLFVRRMIEVETDIEKINCWCYLYNVDVNGLKLITSGDYREYRKGL